MDIRNRGNGNCMNSLIHMSQWRFPFANGETAKKESVELMPEGRSCCSSKNVSDCDIEEFKQLITLQPIASRMLRRGAAVMYSLDQNCCGADFEGYSRKNAAPASVALQTLKILQGHYPERLGLAICYHPPWLFQLVWRVSKCHPRQRPHGSCGICHLFLLLGTHPICYSQRRNRDNGHISLGPQA